MIYSIGYQRLSIEKLIKKLDEYKIDLLVDVRSKPTSRNPAFRYSNLKQQLGTRYVWLGRTLGGLTGKRLPGYSSSVQWLFNTSKTKNVCIMCMETNPRKCHRGMWISEDLKTEYGVDVQHIIDGIVKWQRKGRQTRIA